MKRKIPFVDLFPQNNELRGQIEEAFWDLVSSSRFIGGSPVTEFEHQLAEAEERRFSIGVKSGTSALILALNALGLPNGAEVITTPMTAVPTVEAIVQANLKPVFCDIDLKTYQISSDAVAAAVNENTRVVLPVHLYGIPAPMVELSNIAKRNGYYLIEDVAQAQGASLNGKRLGTWGDAACFSFFPSKCLGGFGDGGAVTTNDKNIADHVREASNHGRLEKFNHSSVGWNERLDTLQAKILGIKLPHLEEWNRMRCEVAGWYLEKLSGVKEIILPCVPDGAVPSWHLFVIRTDCRDELAAYLKESQVQTGLHYPIPVHLHQGYGFLGHGKGDFPNAEETAETVLSLPMYPHLSESDVDYIAEKIHEFFRGRSRSASECVSHSYGE